MRSSVAEAGSRPVGEVPTAPTSCHASARAGLFPRSMSRESSRCRPRRLRYWQKTRARAVFSLRVGRHGRCRSARTGARGGRLFTFSGPADGRRKRRLRSSDDLVVSCARSYRWSTRAFRCSASGAISKPCAIALPELDDPGAALRLLDEASPRLVVRHDGRISRRPTGQLLLEFDDGRGPEQRGGGGRFRWRSSRRRALRLSRIRTRRRGALLVRAGLRARCEAERAAEAIEAYETGARDSSPTTPTPTATWAPSGTTRASAPRPSRAFEACLAREADHVEANFNLANVLEEEGDDRGALARTTGGRWRRTPSIRICTSIWRCSTRSSGRAAKPAFDHWRRYLQLDPDRDPGPKWPGSARARVRPGLRRRLRPGPGTARRRG